MGFIIIHVACMRLLLRKKLHRIIERVWVRCPEKPSPIRRCHMCSSGLVTLFPSFIILYLICGFLALYHGFIYGFLIQHSDFYVHFEMYCQIFIRNINEIKKQRIL